MNVVQIVLLVIAVLLVAWDALQQNPKSLTTFGVLLALVALLLGSFLGR